MYSRVTMKVADTRRNEFERGDPVVVRRPNGSIADEGRVVRATASAVTIDGKWGRAVYTARFVEVYTGIPMNGTDYHVFGEE